MNFGRLLGIIFEELTFGPSGRVFPLVKTSIKLHSTRAFAALDFVLVDIILVGLKSESIFSFIIKILSLIKKSD